MQIVALSVEFQFAALLTGLCFALFTLAIVWFYSTKEKYRKWALAQILFSIAFLWSNIFVNSIPLFGYFMTMLTRWCAITFTLRIFLGEKGRKIPTKFLNPLLILIVGSFWVSIVLLELPTIYAAIPTSILMFSVFAFVSWKIALMSTKSCTQKAISAVYMLWAIVSLPVTIQPFVPEFFVFGYLQFICQTFISLLLLLEFIQNHRTTLETQVKMSHLVRNLLSHDLRNYLNIITQAIELVEVDDEENTRYLTIAKNSLNSATSFMTEIRETLIDLSSASSNFVRLKIKPILDEVIERVITEHELDPNQIIITGISENNFVTTSPIIAQALWNILDNSVRYSTKKPAVEISFHPDLQMTLVISDVAGGIPQEIKETLLLKSNGRNSLGIGLKIVKDLLTICEVNLDIQDRYSGNEVTGTSFLLTFNL
ncbi:MAG: sensor histidine kinase [Candidatus Thorarchaeota archaeon]